MKTPIARLINAVLPSTCLSCGQDIWPRTLLSKLLCLNCASQIDWLEQPFLSEGSEPLAVYAVARYEGPVRELIHAFKYEGRDQIGVELALEWLDRTPYIASDFTDVSFVPMSPFKELKRGYNPAKIIAQTIAKAWGVPMVSNLLSKKWLARSQTNFGRRSRQKNAMKNFGLKRQSKILQGRSVLLVDDVCTTGATLKACASLLRKLGATQVYGATLVWEDN